MIKNIQALRWCPGQGYEYSLDINPPRQGKAISADAASTAPRTLGGERLDNTATRYPWTWVVVHPSTTWTLGDGRR
jgi:hypothetical protein